jgi:3-oxoacyl-[acyl-carrier-protein] synthase II
MLMGFRDSGKTGCICKSKGRYNTTPKVATSSSRHRVAITAAGIVSPLGANLAETVDALRTGRDCVSAVTAFDVSKCRSKTAGQVPDGMLREFTTRKQRRLHRASQMLIAATREALAQDFSFKPDALVIGTTSGGMSFGEAFYRSLMNGNGSKGRATWVANYSPQKPIVDVQNAFNIAAPAQIIANACASGTNAIGHAFRLVRGGHYQRILCGGYDAISELVFVGFDSLQASTPEKCRPFDKERTGLVLGEGASLMALESFESAHERGAQILAEITGYGMSTDNHHLTQPHPSGSGPLHAMSRALKDAGRDSNDVCYINAHGTATPFNDATEGTAISQLFGQIPVSSTKSMMGHALGAAGAIEAAVCLVALREGFLPPNINFREADTTWTFDVVANESRAAKLRCILSNSFGFGGTNASILIEHSSASTAETAYSNS